MKMAEFICPGFSLYDSFAEGSCFLVISRVPGLAGKEKSDSLK